MKKSIRALSLAATAAMAATLALAPMAGAETPQTITPATASVAIAPGTSLDSLPSDGWFTFDSPAPDPQVGARAAAAAPFERWFSGEFKASLSGAKWYTSGGNISASIAASNCTPGYPSINVDLTRTVGGVVTNSWRKSLSCGGATSLNWGTHTAGTYNLYFSRKGPTSFDENTKRVEGSVTYNP